MFNLFIQCQAIFDMEDEAIIVTGNAEMSNVAKLEVIRKTYNIYAEKVNENPGWTMNMSQYCKDVYFLINLINEMGLEIRSLKDAST